MLVQCAICGKKFKPRTIRQICCSVECGYERQKEKSRLKPKKPEPKQPTQLERLHAELLRRRRQREYDQMFKELERMGLQ